MIYRLKNDNYCTFEVFRKNKLPGRAYFIPFSEKEKALSTGVKEARYVSDLVSCLSGDWEFSFYKDPKLLAGKIDTDDIDFDRVKVPSVWEYTGYLNPMYLGTYAPFHFDPPKIPTDKEIGLFRLANNNIITFYAKDQYNSIGVYRKKIFVSDLSKRYIISFLGVAPCMDLFVNGKFVGYSEGSHNTAEFLLDEFLVEGENELVVVIHRFCTGTYLETQDMYRNSGIFRDVLLYATEKKHILDYLVKTPFSEKGYDLSIDVTIENGEAGDEVEVEFLGKKYVEKCDAAGKVNFVIKKPKVEEWSAEIPTLYTLTIGYGGKEYVCEKVGFKHIEIIKDTFLFNGKRIVLKGVNHHDTHAVRGSALTIEDMEKDVLLMKQYNVNAVRTSHYPPDPVFVRLCREKGLYLIEEADIETHCTHAARNLSYISSNEKWKEHYLDRVKSMYKRDKNLTNVILWSLGNESGGLVCQKYCYDYLKTQTDVPIHYEWCGAATKVGFDVLSEMYTSLEDMKKRAAERAVNPDRMKPYVLCEYAHAMGVGPGALEDYVELFLSEDVYMGGCIWEWADHTVYHKENGNFTYGGDHHDYINDKTFCIDGLFRGDRVPYTSAFSMKTAYRPIRAKHIGEGKVEFFNTNRFRSSDYLEVKTCLVVDGTEGKEKKIDLSLAPMEKKVLTFDYPADKDVFLNVSYFDKEENRTIAEEQVTLHESFAFQPYLCACAPEKLRVIEDGRKIKVLFGGNTSITFDRRKAGICSYKAGGTEMIAPRPKNRHKVFGVYEELYRAPLCNDVRVRKEWKKLGLSWYRIGATRCVLQKEGEKVKVVFSYRLYNFLTPIASIEDVYTLSPGGETILETTFKPRIKTMLPRVGKTFEFKYDFDKVRYYGRGEMESAPDMKSHTKVGIFSSEGNFGVKMVVPQCSGERCDVRWAEITDEEGIGIRIEGREKAFGLNVNHYDEKRLASWKHIVDYKDVDATFVSVDGFLCGVGSASCGPLPEKEYQIEEGKELRFSFAIYPIFDKR